MRLWRSGVALGAALVVVLLAAAPASASSVSVAGTEVVYSGDPGDNTLTVTQTGSTYAFDDSVAITGTPPECVTDAGDGTNATCTLAGTTAIRVNADGGSDVITISGSTPSIIDVQDGAAGDTATCGAGDDTALFDIGDTVTGCEHQDDGLPPDTAITGGPSGVIGSATGQSFSFTSDDLSSHFECDLTGPDNPSDPAPCTSPQELKPPFVTPDSLQDGTYTFFVTAIDEFGRRDPQPAERSFTLDRTAPQIIVTRRDPTNTSTAHFQLDTIDNSAVTLECAVGNDAPGPCSASEIFTTRVLADGDYVLFVTGTDAAGNSTTTEAPFRINAVAGGGGVGPPTPTSARPTSKIIIDSLVLISGSTVKMSRRGVVRISLTCAGKLKCKGRMKITTAEPVSRKSKKLVTLGSKRFAIGANKKKKVSVRFSKKTKRLARRLKRFKAKVVINEVDSRGNKRISSRVFVLRAR